ncbi:MAG: sodium/solute symporter [Planctomycetaceae bacterium]
MQIWNTASCPPAALEPGDHVVIGVYLAAMLWMGFSIARKQKSTDDFFVGGRNLPAWAVGISIFASLLSTITYLGMPGEMFRTGAAFLTRQLPIPLVLVVVWFLWIPFFMRLKLTSAYEYLERRFNYTTRALGAVFCLLLLFGWISVVVLTASNAMAEIVELNLGWWPNVDTHVMIVSVGLFSVVYTTMGGIRAVIWTDVIQFLVLMIGAFFTMGFIAFETGSGLTDWIATSQTYKHEAVEWFKPDVGDRSNVVFISLGMFFWFICTHGSNQIALQRYFTVRNAREARKSYLVSAVASIFIGVTLAGVGISLVHYTEKSPDSNLPAESDLESKVTKVRNKAQDSIFPQFISQKLPWGLRGMVVAALFAAAMSTIDSGANSASTIVTVDFLRRSANAPREGSAEELKRARTMTATSGIIVVAYTMLLHRISEGTDIITLCQKGFNCFLGPLGAVFALGMFSKRVTARSMVPAFLLGEVVGVCSSYSDELFGRPFSTHLVIAVSWLATVVVAWLSAVIMRTRVSEEQQRLLWGPVVRGRNA